MKNKVLVRFAIATSFAAAILFAKHIDVKASSPEMNQAMNFYNAEINWMGNTNYASNQDQNVRNVYAAAQSAQIAQTLATSFNAALNNANATRQAAINNWQLQQNYQAYMTNLDAEHRNMNSMVMYNYQNTSDRNFANSISAINNYYAFMLGQSPAPIYTAP